MTKGGVFIGTVATVIVTVTGPSTENTTPGRIALEFVLGTRNVAVEFVGSIAAIVGTVAEGRRCCAIVVFALELTRFAESLMFGATGGFV